MVRSRSQRKLRAGSIIVLPNGAQVVLPADWESLSIEQMAALGILPNMIGESEIVTGGEPGGEGTFTQS